MKTTKLLLTGMLISTLSTAGFAMMDNHEHAKSSITTQTICPMMGEKINKNYYVDVDGKRIYTCCSSCINAIKKNPEKYVKQMESKGIVLEDAPSK